MDTSLAHRQKQAVRVDTTESTCCAVDSGVPQGSVFVPPLFNIFIDGLDKAAMLIEMIKNFADDTKGLKVIKDEHDRDCFQRTLDNFAGAANDWGMKINIPKCKIMQVRTHNPGYKFKMEGTELQEVVEEKT